MWLTFNSREHSHKNPDVICLIPLNIWACLSWLEGLEGISSSGILEDSRWDTWDKLKLKTNKKSLVSLTFKFKFSVLYLIWTAYPRDQTTEAESLWLPQGRTQRDSFPSLLLPFDVIDLVVLNDSFAFFCLTSPKGCLIWQPLYNEGSQRCDSSCPKTHSKVIPRLLWGCSITRTC